MNDSNQNHVAVIIVNYNGGDHVIRCLTALHKQSHMPDKIVVVDNNSIDDSNTQIRNRFKTVELIQMPENMGFAAANNRAFETLQGYTWVALLNPDTIPFENWLEKLLDGIRNNPGYDIFSSQMVSAMDHDQLDGAGDTYHVSGLSWRRYHGLTVRQPKTGNDPVFSPCAAAALYKLDTVLKVGGFDEAYFCYHEDVDLVFRMRLLGAECAYIESSIVAHVGSGLTGKDSDFSVYHGHRNLVWTYLKNMPGWLVFWYLPQHLALNVVTLIYYTAKGRGRIIWKSKWHAFKGIGAVLEKRKSVQENRKVPSSSITNAMAKGLLRPYISRFR